MSRNRQNQISEEAHIQNILLLMETQRLQFEEAQLVYEAAGRNISRAMSSSAPYPTDKHQTKPKTGGISSIQGLNFQGLEDAKKNRYIEDQRRAQQQKERLERNRQNYRKTYIIRKQQKSKIRPLNYKRKEKPTNKQSRQIPIQIEDEPTFRLNLQKFVGGRLTVVFSEELSECFEEMWNTHRFMAVHSLHIVQSRISSLERQIMETLTKDVYRNPFFGQIFNKEFINYGLNPKNFQFHIYPFMREFVNVERDKHTLIILRYNQKTNEVVCAKKINLIEAISNVKPEIFHKNIQMIKKDINRIIDQEVCPSIHHSPLGQVDKRQLDESRKIQQQQDKAYKDMQKNIKIKKKQQLKDANEESDKEIELMKKQVMRSLQAQQLKKQKELRQSLVRYKPEQIKHPIMLKLRLPNGQVQKLVLPNTEKVEYLFNYVKSHDGDLGFENEIYRPFDIVQPWEDKRSLENSKQQVLKAIFGQSVEETLVVKQF